MRASRSFSHSARDWLPGGVRDPARNDASGIQREVFAGDRGAGHDRDRRGRWHLSVRFGAPADARAVVVILVDVSGDVEATGDQENLARRQPADVVAPGGICHRVCQPVIAGGADAIDGLHQDVREGSAGGGVGDCSGHVSARQEREVRRRGPAGRGDNHRPICEIGEVNRSPDAAINLVDEVEALVRGDGRQIVRTCRPGEGVDTGGIGRSREDDSSFAEVVAPDDVDWHSLNRGAGAADGHGTGYRASLRSRRSWKQKRRQKRQAVPEHTQGSTRSRTGHGGIPLSIPNATSGCATGHPGHSRVVPTGASAQARPGA